MDKRAQEVIDFWQEIGPKAWFARNDAIDAQITDKFAALHGEAAKGRLDGWMQHAGECLALVILLDQFSRNMFRGGPKAFACDAHALAVANHAIASGFHLDVDPGLADFFFMPLMHSESVVDQRRCVALMHAYSNPQSVHFAKLHLRIIERFGRFPHRNPMLGRNTTPAEKAYMDGGGFSA